MSTTPTLGRLRSAAVLAALAAIALPASAPAQAAGAMSAACTSRFTITITPGFSMTPSSGTVTTHGQTGSITCVGTIGGHRVTGPGTMAIDQTYTGTTCPSGVASGTIRITLPTTAGIKHMLGALTVRRTALVIRPEARFPGARFSGVGVVLPTQGNCFVTALRRALISVTGSLSGA